jgi:putative ABC transport system permease protein
MNPEVKHQALGIAAPRVAWGQGVGLAMRDLWHDRRTSCVLVLTVTAILAPLLLLLGLKTGTVTAMRQSLLSDPRNLEIVIYGNTRLERSWFDAYAARADVAFILPRTRTINATIDLIGADRRIRSAVEVIPTAAGDPLLPEEAPLPVRANQILVTETLAEALAAGPGTRVTGVVKRSTDGRSDNALLDLEVIGVVPESRFARDAVFTHLNLLVASEDYRDGLRKTLTSADLGEPSTAGRQHFANARLYAADLEAVATVAESLRAEGIEIRTQAERIRVVRAIDNTLSFVFQVIALIGGIGCALALGGALRVNVERKRRDLALLRLFGFPTGTLVLVPVSQAVAIASAGFLLAYLAYLAGAGAFNQVLGANLSDKGYVCRLEWTGLLTASAATMVVALASAAAGGHRASRIEPADCLRQA